MLLLTATPFQLHLDELREVLTVVDSMERAIGADRVKVLQELRQVLWEAMNVSEDAGKKFSLAWGGLEEQFTLLRPEYATDLSRLPAEEDARTLELDKLWKSVRTATGEEQTRALQKIRGPLLPFFSRALQLRDANQRLRDVMAPLIIRHRRETAHRRYWIGKEYPPVKDRSLRPDQP